MYGIMTVELQSRRTIDVMVRAAKNRVDIAVYTAGNNAPYHQPYQTEAACDRAWAMMEKAIAYGARLFRFPTDAELEKGEDE